MFGLGRNTLWKVFQGGLCIKIQDQQQGSRGPGRIAETKAEPQGCVMLDALMPSLFT